MRALKHISFLLPHGGTGDARFPWDMGRSANRFFEKGKVAQRGVPARPGPYQADSLEQFVKTLPCRPFCPPPPHLPAAGLISAFGPSPFPNRPPPNEGPPARYLLAKPLTLSAQISFSIVHSTFCSPESPENQGERPLSLFAVAQTQTTSPTDRFS